MTERENLLRLLTRKGFEWIPPEMNFCPSLYERFKEETGETDYASYFGFPWRGVGIVQDDPNLDRFLPYFGGSIGPDVTIDGWGVGHRSTPTSMHMTEMLCPLKDAETVEELLAYPMPSFSEENNRNLWEQVQKIHDQGLAAVGQMQCTIWESTWYLRRMENLMMDMLCDEEMADTLFSRVEKTAVDRAVIYAKAGVDILYLGDDVGMQHSIMMSLDLYKKWILPRLKHVIQAAREINPDIVIIYHSCGFVEPFIPLWIEAGIDVLNPLQSECMDFEKIHAQYGDKISFHGTVGTQTVMPFGTPEEVKAYVKRNLDIAGEKGGLMIAPTHMLEPEVPWENILAYVEACREYTK